MGLSTIAAYGILFTASLFMLGVILNSLIYSYDSVQDGLKNRVDIINNAKNTIEVDRIFYKNGNIVVRAFNKGPNTLRTAYMSIIVNGTNLPFNSSVDYWYPGEYAEFYIFSPYDMGDYHNIQFILDSGDSVIASGVKDKVYIANSTYLMAYNFTGEELWEVKIPGIRDVSVSDYVYTLNSTEILKYDKNGNFVSSFGVGMNLSAIDSSDGRIYGINSSSMVILDSSGNLVNSVALSDGRDIACGSQLYVLDGNTIKIYALNGAYISSFTDYRITNATKITADNKTSKDYVFVLNNENEILVYRNGNYIQEIPLQTTVRNIDVYGKIYLCSQGVYGMNVGYRIKMVDEYGNEFYDFM